MAETQSVERLPISPTERRILQKLADIAHLEYGYLTATSLEADTMALYGLVFNGLVAEVDSVIGFRYRIRLGGMDALESGLLPEGYMRF